MLLKETDVPSYWPDVSLSKSRLLALFSESFFQEHAGILCDHSIYFP
jgi:hypothetical protein